MKYRDWTLCLGALILLSSAADARLTRLTDRGPLQDGSDQGNSHLVQMRKAPTQDSRRYDAPVPDVHEDVRVGACAEKIRKMFPATALPVSALALDQARVDQREQTVVIPLKDPQAEMRAIWFDTNSMTEALEAIHLLRTGKIGALSVSPLAHRPSMLYMFRGVSKEDREACTPERVLEVLGKCAECEVQEWLSIRP